MTIFFTSDTHFGHKNVIKYANRPFLSAPEMDDFMIKKWRDTVTDEDMIFFLGDFSFVNKNRTENIFNQLPGNKTLIQGNHDHKYTRNLPWTNQHRYHEVIIEKQVLILFHYPIASWNRMHRGSLHLHGHSHGSMPQSSQRIDVGVDCWDFTPITLDDILQRAKTFPQTISEDHHQ